MPGEALCLSERVQIEVDVAAGELNEAIAQGLGRSPSTIGREFARNGGRERYQALVAQARADRQRRRPKRTCFQQDPALAAHVVARLRALDSPMTIAVELARGVYPNQPVTVSHETIYQGVYGRGRRGLPTGLYQCLHRRRGHRKARHGAGRPAKVGPLGVFNLIGTRPTIAAERVQVGHLEGDLILGSNCRSAIATVFDRTSRYLWLGYLGHGHSADEVLYRLIELLDRIPPPLRRTLTWDQGSEMARHAELAEICGIDIYFADRHSPWQRPTNENGNGHVRRYVGKGTDLNVYSQADLHKLEHRINTTPRRCLDWATASDVYYAAVALTT